LLERRNVVLAIVQPRLGNRTIIDAWGGNFTTQSLSYVDQAGVIEKQLDDLQVSNSPQSEVIDAKSHKSLPLEAREKGAKAKIHPGLLNFWKLADVGRARLPKDTALPSQRLMPLLRRALILLHLGRWIEAATMSLSLSAQQPSFLRHLVGIAK